MSLILPMYFDGFITAFLDTLIAIVGSEQCHRERKGRKVEKKVQCSEGDTGEVQLSISCL